MRYTAILMATMLLVACSYTVMDDPAQPTITIEPSDSAGDTVNEVINDARELDGEAIRDSVRFGISWPIDWFNRKD